MPKSFLIVFLVIFSGICNYSKAQTEEKTLSAKEYFDKKDYNNALKEYLKLYRNDKDNIEINYNIGFCYLRINSDKSRSIPFLEFVYKNGDYKDEVLLYLGMAYMYSYKFDEALNYFIDYRKIIYSKRSELVPNFYEDRESGNVDYQKKITSNNFGIVDHLIENCENAKELIKAPLSVTFENLGKDINSKYADYSPFITRNQGALYFSSNREENHPQLINSMGNPTSDIYISEVKEGQWTKAKNLGANINTAAEEQCVYVTPGGKKMLVFKDNDTIKGDLFSVPLEELLQNIPVGFIEPVNTEYREFEGCITEDETKIFISSDRPGGLGETDIYMFNKLPNGNWGTAINLGPQVNTRYKEAFPMYDEKDSVLYFASEGHTNMGGFDIFSSQFDSETNTFGPAENIGYPVNTPEDEMVFSMAENKHEGYISAVIKGGFGDLDIYKVVFNDIENRPSIIRGVVSLSDASKKEIDAFVSLRNTKTNKEADSKNVNPQNGRYVFAVGPGKYILTASSPKHKDVEQEVIVYDKSDYVFEIERNIVLEKIVDSSLLKKDTIMGVQTKPKNAIIRGFISTNNKAQKHIDAFVSILDIKTRQQLEGKTANPQSGRYFFAVDTGKYIITVTSPGYEIFEEEINVFDKSDFIFEIEKNILLKKITTPASSVSTKTETTIEKSPEKTTKESTKETTKETTEETTEEATTDSTKETQTTIPATHKTSATKKNATIPVKKKTTPTKKKAAPAKKKAAPAKKKAPSKK